MYSKNWENTLFTHIWVFNVGRGLSIFIRTALNQGIIYDLGSSEEFSPTEFIKEHILPHLDEYKGCKIAQTIISHPHIDHFSEIEMLPGADSPFYSSLHTCPHDKKNGTTGDERIDWDRVNNPKGAENKIMIYKDLYAKRTLPLQTIQYDSPRSVPNLEYGIYYLRPPKVDELYPSNDQNYANATSLVLFFRHGFHTLLIPGDMLPEAMEYLLEEKLGHEKRYTVFDSLKSQKHPDWHKNTSNQPSLKACLQTYGLSILIAPHHGLVSGYSDALYSSIKCEKPKLVVISEKKHLSPTDGIVDRRYQSEQGASALFVDIEGKIEKRYSISTCNGHHILIVFPGTGGSPKVYAEKSPEDLIEKI